MGAGGTALYKGSCTKTRFKTIIFFKIQKMDGKLTYLRSKELKKKFEKKSQKNTTEKNQQKSKIREQ